MKEPEINYNLLDRLRSITDKPLVEDDAYTIWRDPEAQERMNAIKLAEICKGYTKTDFAVVVTIALANYPEVVLKAILDALEEGSNE